LPDRIGVVVPAGLTEFTRALLFFHPSPGAAGYDDWEYTDKRGKWADLNRYLDALGYQLAASRAKQVLFVPYFTEAAMDNLGAFAQHWQTMLEEILELLRLRYAPSTAGRPKLADVVATSYSAGVKYLHTFLSRAVNVNSFVREVYDYDGRFSDFKALSEQLKGAAAWSVTNYDQRAVEKDQIWNEFHLGRGIHLPLWRWLGPTGKGAALVNGKGDVGKAIHRAIPQLMLFHSLSALSKVG
jgi:hypothetical protein